MEWCQLDAKKSLEFSKKMAVLRKLLRLELISEDEYILANNKIMSSYHILESEYFKTNDGKKVAQQSLAVLGVKKSLRMHENVYPGSFFL